MYSKWIKSGFILAMLLVSMVSLSMAGCPWFIKNDLYTAQCGVLKVVPASNGILANDPAGTKVVDPESIEIDPKYGTISVEEDGSFVYDPTGATALRSGTYVIFKYVANNGFCNAKYLGTAKIQVGCKCKPEVCDDGLDNDCDGLKDGDDDDCIEPVAECDPLSCFAMPQCSDSCNGGNNACFSTPEGNGICAAHTSCSDKVGCSTSADCAAAGVDGVCIICTGCDYYFSPLQGICQPASNYCTDDGARQAVMQIAAQPDGRTTASR